MRKLHVLTSVFLGGKRMKIYVTNEYQHSGIRDDGFEILDKLLGMLAGTVDVPS